MFQKRLKQKNYLKWKWAEKFMAASQGNFLYTRHVRKKPVLGQKEGKGLLKKELKDDITGSDLGR